MPRLTLDFPPVTGGRQIRRVFRDPVEVVTARRAEGVEDALERVARGVERGLSAAGYLSYEAAPAFDSAFRIRSGARMDLLWFGLFEGDGDPAPAPRARAPATLSAGPETPSGAPEPADPPRPWKLDVSAETFAARIERIRRAIEAGETYQVNYTARLRAHFAGDPARLYDRLRAAQGTGYHALLELEGHTVVSASPELFFGLEGRSVVTRPMKGTSPRGRWLEEDEELARRLRESEKERAENRMIVDLLRNDLGRVAEIGSVEVPRALEVERYRTVLQMTSTVTARLPEGRDFRDVLRALFPCGSVTGAPKIHTMGLIAELEDSPREVYCGALGFVEGGTGSAVFNVPIRTLWIDRESGDATYGVGSGVTWSSTAEGEYRELRDKARILSESWPDFDLLESLRLEDGSFHRLERHLARMSRSARYFQRAFPADEIRSALAGVAAAHPDGVWKIRLTLSEDGEIDLGAERIPPETPSGAPARRIPAGAAPDPVGDDPAFEADRPGVDPGPRPPGAALAGPPPSPGAKPVPVVLAAGPVDSSDRFLYHKTTHRAVYEGHRGHESQRPAPDSHRADRGGIFDVLLWNERGEITEFTTGNVVARMDGRWLTPPRTSGLLAGCFREELLEEDVLVERAIRVRELDRTERLWLVNSVRGWVPVTLVRPQPTETPSEGRE